MTSPYPLPEGCIFREDFINPKLAADNGLVVISPTWQVGGGLNAVVANIAAIRPSKAYTVIFDVGLTSFTPVNTFRTLFNPPFTGFLGVYNNTLFYYDDYSAATYSPGVLYLGRNVVAVVVDNNTSRFFHDGVQVASGSRASIRSYLNVASIFSVGAGSFRLLDSLYLFVYCNYAMSADEIRQATLRIRGLKS